MTRIVFVTVCLVACYLPGNVQPDYGCVPVAAAECLDSLGLPHAVDSLAAVLDGDGDGRVPSDSIACGIERYCPQVRAWLNWQDTAALHRQEPRILLTCAGDSTRHAEAVFDSIPAPACAWAVVTVRKEMK